MTYLSQAAELATAVHSRLSQEGRVTDVLGDPARLYDSPPEDPVYPYLTYGDMRSEDQSGDGVYAVTHTLSLHVWSRYSGRAEVFDIINAVASALTSDLITLDGGEAALPIILYIDVLRAGDGRTLHGLIRLKCHIQTPESGS